MAEETESPAKETDLRVKALIELGCLAGDVHHAANVMSCLTQLRNELPSSLFNAGVDLGDIIVASFDSEPAPDTSDLTGILIVIDRGLSVTITEADQDRQIANVLMERMIKVFNVAGVPKLQVSRLTVQVNSTNIAFERTAVPPSKL